MANESATLRALRGEVKDALEIAGLNAIDWTEARFTPPVLIVSPDDPYLVPEGPFGAFTVGIRVLVIGGKREAGSADELDALVTKALLSLREADLDVVEVTAPAVIRIETTGSSHFGTIIRIQFNSEIKEEDA